MNIDTDKIETPRYLVKLDLDARELAALRDICLRVANVNQAHMDPRQFEQNVARQLDRELYLLLSD